MLDLRAEFILVAFLISLSMGLYIIPRVVMISKRKRLFDKLDHRKDHSRSVSRLGGTVFFPIAMFSFTFMMGLRYMMNLIVDENVGIELTKAFLLITSGLVIIFFIGFYDDLIGANHKKKFMIQALGGILVCMGGIYFKNIEGLFFVTSNIPAVIGVVLTIFFVVFTVNAYNLIDGVNGLCSGLSLVALFGYGSWFAYVGLYFISMALFSFAGVVMSFFYYNIKGRRLQIFMGDTGSLTLGFIIAATTMLFLNTSYNGNNSVDLYHKLPIVAGLIFVPIFDTFRVFATRIYNGKSPFHPDRSHIHHKLLDLGMTHVQSTITLIFTQVSYLVINFLMSEIFKINVNIIFIVDLLIALVAFVLIEKRIKCIASSKCRKIGGTKE